MPAALAAAATHMPAPMETAGNHRQLMQPVMSLHGHLYCLMMTLQPPAPAAVAAQAAAAETGATIDRQLLAVVEGTLVAPPAADIVKQLTLLPGC